AKGELERDFGSEVFTILANGSVEEEVRAAVEAGAEHFGGRIDVLINNAQASASGLTLVQHSEEDFDLAVRSGLYATFFYMKHAYPYLKETAGSVINFASGAGIGGNPGQSSYAAAKEGIRGMSRVAASECRQHQREHRMPHRHDEGARGMARAQARDVREEREGDPARTLRRRGEGRRTRVRVLSRPDASFVTGDTIMVQGGSGMKP
ncbi:MAG: SDR family NAD(P)-dependent oxidoreductase, partial [Eggerthella lenta]